MKQQTTSVISIEAERLRARLDEGERLSADEWQMAASLKWAELGSEMREQRVTLGCSLAEMARLTGFSASTLSRFEHGRSVGRANVIESSYRLVFALRKQECSNFRLLGAAVDVLFALENGPGTASDADLSNVVNIDFARATRKR